MKPLELVLASNNQNKLKELNSLLGSMGLALIPQGILNIPEAEEPFCTFVENALAKARHASQLSQKAAIADDSGISVQALQGEPGVYSARYAQYLDEHKYPQKDDLLNNQLLLEKMGSQTYRGARFICVLAAVRHANDPEPLIAIGRWNGEVSHEPKGSGGFGYDPLMYIPELNKTVAELTSEEKNRCSHRAQAMKIMQAMMRDYWSDILPKY